MAVAPERRSDGNLNYTLGRGRLYFSREVGGVLTWKNWLYIASTSEFNYNLEPEELEHVNADSGVRNVDDSVVLSRGLTGSIVTDDIQAENLALFFYGTAAPAAQPAVNHHTTNNGESFASVQPGDILQLGVTAARPQGIAGIDTDPLSAVTTVGNRPSFSIVGDAAADFNPAEMDTTDEAGTYPDFRPGTHFNADAKSGIVEIIHPQPDGSAIDGDGATVHFFYKAAAANRTQVLSGISPVRGAIMFEQDNPKGLNRVYTIPSAIIRANGDLALKGDEWLSIPLSFEAVDRGTGTELLYIDSAPAA